MTTESIANYENESQNYENNSTILRASITKGDLLNFVEAIRAIDDDAKVYVTEDGLYVRIVDPAHIAVAEVMLSAKAFGTYEVGVGGPFVMSLKDAKAALSFAKRKGEIIDITVTRCIENRVGEAVEVTRVALGIGGMTRTMEPYVPKRYPDFKMPNIREPSSSVIVEADTLKRFVDQAKKVCDWMSFTVTPDGLAMATDTRKDGAVVLDVPRGELVSLHCEDGKTYRSLFPLDYVRLIVRGLRPIQHVELKIDTDRPIFIASLPSDKCFGLSMRYVMAPRIEPNITEEY
jgi:proliferating cell nuclear antigen